MRTRCKNGTKTGQIEQLPSVHGWPETGSNGEHSPILSNDDEKKQSNKAVFRARDIELTDTA